MISAHGIPIKKRFGQHFLRDETITEHMIAAVHLDKNSSVFEIGCGDGFLTREILKQPIERLWIFEIDPEWIAHVRAQIIDQRMQIFEENILDVEPSRFTEHTPWTILANIPYQITLPLFFMFQRMGPLIAEGVLMIQEEVAQKLVGRSGRGYGFISLFFQYHFELKLLDKISPKSFLPPPKVFSRLIYLKPKTERQEIPDEQAFWKFIKVAFHQPRRTLRNNLLPYPQYSMDRLDPKTLMLRAQQLAFDDFLKIWEILS